MCGHSFHNRCLMDERHCNICSAHIADIRQRATAVRQNSLPPHLLAANMLHSDAINQTNQIVDMSTSFAQEDETDEPALVGPSLSSSSSSTSSSASSKPARRGRRNPKESRAFDEFMSHCSSDGFSTIAEYFSKGLFNTVCHFYLTSLLSFLSFTIYFILFLLFFLFRISMLLKRKKCTSLKRLVWKDAPHPLLISHTHHTSIIHSHPLHPFHHYHNIHLCYTVFLLLVVWERPLSVCENRFLRVGSKLVLIKHL